LLFPLSFEWWFEQIKEMAMTIQLLQISDRVRVGGKLGAVVAVEPRPRATIYTIAFTKGLPQKFISPPTIIEKIYSPIELLKSTDFDSPIRFDLHFEASRLSLAYEYDHLLSLSSTRTNLEPYQVEAVHKVLNSYKQRFLIADDVGLGKTIEAGMILKELALRGRAKRVLIIVPAPLRYQWQREMRERFDENFIIYDSFYLRALKDSLGKTANVWDAHRKIITSLDYAKREEVLVELERTKWDFIIFDEAHKLSASKYGNKIERSQRFRLSQRLRDNTESLILLTGTPHRGDSFAFYSLVSLVDPYIFENETNISSPKLNSIMIRRGKEGIRDVLAESRGGSEDIQLKEAYKRVYNAGTRYREPDFFQDVLSSKEIKLKPKSKNIAGLQLADILAHPVKQSILQENKEIPDPGNIFGKKICEVIKTKYNRHLYQECIKGYGRIFI